MRSTLRSAPRILTLAAFAITSAHAQQAVPTSEGAPQIRIQQVAEFPHQVTGVAVSNDDRIFVNFPRWTEDSPVSVAEVGRDGSIRPYPNDEWDTWRNARRDTISPQDHWVCVQSVVADDRGSLWVLDPAAPAQAYAVPGGPKLVRINLAANAVAQVIAFDESVAPQGSYLDDVRFSSDGRHAYITDSGAVGALIVVDISSGNARRVLHNHPSTQVEKGLVVKADGKELRRPDGRGVEFAADGLALTPDGRYLYWQAIKGKTLYRIPTEALNASGPQADRDLGLKVEAFGENGVADGLHIGRKDGRMYITAPEENAVKVRDLSHPKSAPTILLQDKQLRWPDTFAEGPDGTIYVTTSRIQDSAFFKLDAPPALTTQLWRVDVRGAGAKTESHPRDTATDHRQ